MTEVWIVLLLYGGGVMTDLRLLDRRGVRRIFGWVRVPHPTTFGRWLRNTGETMVALLDEVLWEMVRRRCAMAGGAPGKLTVMMDSTVVVRYGRKQAGAELQEARPSVASSASGLRAGDRGLPGGVRLRPGSAHTAKVGRAHQHRRHPRAGRVVPLQQGAVVEQRIEELVQLSAGRTAVDDLDGNALLWSLAVLAYQTLHTLREQCRSGSWRKAQPRRVRL